MSDTQFYPHTVKDCTDFTKLMHEVWTLAPYCRLTAGELLTMAARHGGNTDVNPCWDAAHSALVSGLQSMLASVPVPC